MESQIKTRSVCDLCLESNIKEAITYNRCKKCDIIFCIHTASVHDPIFCEECLKNVNITIKPTQRKAIEINFSGADWLFIHRKISMLTDTELQLAIEYHWAIMNSMLREREDRRREAFRKSVIKSTTFTVKQVSKITEEQIATKARVKKEKKEDLAKILQDLLKQGFTKEQIITLATKK